MIAVSVVIPTFRRPDALLRAARSVLAQTDVRASIELVIVDNDPAGSAAHAIQAAGAEAVLPVRGVHEPRAGVANARNAGWAAAQGGIIVFLDDDEEAAPGWLAAILAARESLEAPVVFGRVVAALPDPSVPHAGFLSGFFARELGPAPTLLDAYYGCGNCLIDRAALGISAPPFDAWANDRGGEDDMLFDPLKRAGVRFGWEPRALVYEHVGQERATLAYVLRRSFAFGQSPSQTCAAAKPPDVLGVGFWMGVGLAQMALYGAGALGLWLARRPGWPRLLGRAAQGAGKVWWFAAPRLYGGAAAPRAAG